MWLFTNIKILLAAIAVEVSCDCGVALSDPIVDGTDAAVFPWLVEIYKESGDDLVESCPGNLISSDVVVTALRCIWNTQKQVDTDRFFIVTVSDLPMNVPKTLTQKSRIETFYRTVGYPAVPEQSSGDLAWLVLQHPLNITSSLGPACINLDNPQDGDELPSGLVGQVKYRETLDYTALPKLRQMKVIPFSHVFCYAIFPNERRQHTSLYPSCVQLSTEIESINRVIGTGFYSQSNGRWYLRAIMTDVYYVATGPSQKFVVALFMNVERYADEISRSGIRKRCGITAPVVLPLVAHGFQTEIGQFPWHVGIYRENSVGQFIQMCAGSLISSKIVISAAHCFYDESRSRKQTASAFVVAAGKLHRSYLWPELFVQKSNVQTIHLTNRYQGLAGLYSQDIAWLILQHPFYQSALVIPICIDFDDTYRSEDFQAGQLGKIAGWGRTEAGVFSDELRGVDLPFIPYPTCIAALPRDFVPYVTNDKFCAGYLNGTTLCDGDSGGGLAFLHRGTWYLRGIVSLSPVGSRIATCPDSYTAFTNIGNFIDEHQRIMSNLTRGLN